MADAANELLVIARLKNELSRPLGQIRGEIAGLNAEITKSGTATTAQSAQLRSLGRELDTQARKTDQMAASFTRLGSTLTRDITLPVLLGLGAATKAAISNERTQAILAQTMRNTEGATKGQIGATEQWIRKTQLATGISDTELRPALGKLMMGHRSVTEAQHDMSIAMDIAQARGLDLNTVVSAMSRASLGSTTSLRKLGFQVKDTAGHALTYTQIMTLAEKATGGQLGATADTTSRHIRQLGQSVRVFGEDIGNKTLPALDGAVKIATGAFNHLGAVPAGQQLAIFGGLALAAAGPVLSIAGHVMKLEASFAKLWKTIALGRGVAAGAEGAEVGGLAGIFGGLGGLVGGGAITGAGLAAPFAIPLAAIGAGALTDARDRSGATKFANNVGGGIDTSTSVGMRQRAAALRTELARQRAVLASEIRKAANDSRRDAAPSDGGRSIDTAKARIKALDKQAAELDKNAKRTESNVGHLTSALSLSRTEVLRLADAAHVDLSGSLQTVIDNMRNAETQARKTGQSISDQAQSYADLKTSIDEVNGTRDLYIDRFTSATSAELGFRSSLGAISTTGNVVERKQAALAAFQQGEQWTSALQTSGSIEDSHAAAAQQLSAVVDAIAKYDPSTANDLRSRVAAFAANAAKADTELPPDPNGNVFNQNVTVNVTTTADPANAKKQAQDGVTTAFGQVLTMTKAQMDQYNRDRSERSTSHR